MATGPRCFRCLMFMSSGPVELLFLACLIACVVCEEVISIVCGTSFLICLFVVLFCLFVLCSVVLVNCLFSISAFCLLVMAVLLLEFIVLLVMVCVMFLSPLIVFQSLWVFCLWSQSPSRCFFHSCSLCFCISLSISVFSCGIWGFLGSSLLVLFLLVIRFLMCGGSSFCVFCIFPLGM